MKGTHTLKRITINSLNINKKQKNEEKFARLATLKDSLGKIRKKSETKREQNKGHFVR